MAIQQMFLVIPSSGAEPDGSVYFDGIDDELKVTNSNSDLQFGTGDFTVEVFVKYDEEPSSSRYIIDMRSSAGTSLAGSLAVGYSSDNSKIEWATPNGPVVQTSWANYISVGTWNHIAVARSGSTIKMFINGTEVDSASDGSNYNIDPTDITIGDRYNNSAVSQWFNGKISNVRIVKGTALYTNSFVPPSSALTNITNTKLLCCNSDSDVTAKTVGGTITANSNPQPSSENPFPFNPLYSVGFDGNNTSRNDYLSIAASSDLNLDGEFTIEAWVKVDDDGWSGIRRTLIANNIGWTTNHFAISLMNSGNSVEENCITLWDYNANSSGAVATSAPVRVETSDGWTHIAVTRDSANNIRIFKNGVQAGSTYNSSNSYLFGTGETWIGQITMSNLAGAESLDGNISNLRVVKGQALYTTSSFTPALSFTTTSQGAIESNVKLLCCNTVTTTGATVSPASINSSGDTTASSESVNGFTTGAITFDGSGDFLYTSHSNDYDFGSGDFTVEAWVRPTNATQTDPSMVALWNFPDGRRSWGIFGNTGGSPTSYNGAVRGTVSPDGQFATRTEITGTLTLNSWNHVAFVRNGNTLNFFINGVSQGTASYTGSVYNNTSDGVMIGAMGDSAGGNNYFNGNISNVRVVKGTCLYTVNFTPPTAALTNVTNTKLLCCQDSSSTSGAAVNSGSISANGEVFATLGPTLPNYSVDFDGDDYISVASSSDLTLGTGDFAIEAWVYPDNFTNRGTIYDGRGSSNNEGLTLGHESSSGELRVYMNANSGSDIVVSSTDFSTGQWQHIAVTRDSGTVRLFVNGALKDSATRTSDMAHQHGKNIGYKRFTSSSYNYFDGKISNLRVVKGSAVYTSAFTPSTERLTVITNTKLLCCNKGTVTGSSITPATISTSGNPLVGIGPF